MCPGTTASRPGKAGRVLVWCRPAAMELPGPGPELPSCVLCSASSPPTSRTLGGRSWGLLVPDLGTSLARRPAV